MRDLFVSADSLKSDRPPAAKAGARSNSRIHFSIAYECHAPGTTGNVVEIVDTGSPRFNKVQQGRLCKWLSLKTDFRDDHMFRSPLTTFSENGLFSTYSVSIRCAQVIERC